MLIFRNIFAHNIYQIGQRHDGTRYDKVKFSFLILTSFVCGFNVFKPYCLYNFTCNVYFFARPVDETEHGPLHAQV